MPLQTTFDPRQTAESIASNYGSSVGMNEMGDDLNEPPLLEGKFSNQFKLYVSFFNLSESFRVKNITQNMLNMAL